MVQSNQLFSYRSTKAPRGIAMSLNRNMFDLRLVQCKIRVRWYEPLWV